MLHRSQLHVSRGVANLGGSAAAVGVLALSISLSLSRALPLSDRSRPCTYGESHIFDVIEPSSGSSRRQKGEAGATQRHAVMG
jgi:hypothetical protein